MSAMNFEVMDTNLWESVNRDDPSAFERLVQRHQSAVCAVAYNACGNLSLSEDIAQETFWVAWRDRKSLLDATRVRAWLCGIARNLARNSRRQTDKASSSLEEFPEPVATTQEPSEQAVSREEECLVWNALEQIPETYREPLILFYRENQSVAEVASTLELTPDTVKQRLSRGRNMLRDQIAEVVEGTLRRSAPHGRFTVSVMAGLTSATAVTGSAMAAGGGSAVAATGIATKAIPAATAVGVSGMAGAIAGTAGGLLGGWLGAWIPAQLAPTNRERRQILTFGRRILVVSVVMSLSLMFVMLAFARAVAGWALVMLIVGWILTLNTYIVVETILLIIATRRIRQETTAESDPNNSWLKAYMERNAVSQWQGRTYRSSTTFLGLPLVDIQIGDPAPNGAPQSPKKARGWIAIGDRADGVLLAVGGIARGAIAIGGASIGLISIGGMSVGLFAVGGGALGAIAVGGLAIGGISFGGGAIGWQAAGGGAIAWDVACGGDAVAYHAAKGGAAIAHDYAVGGEATALHANDDAAKAVLNSHWLVKSIEWYADHLFLTQTIVIATCVLVPIASQLLMYKRR